MNLGVDVLKHLSDQHTQQTQHQSGNKHAIDLQKQEHMQQTLQAVMAARQQNKPTKGNK